MNIKQSLKNSVNIFWNKWLIAFYFVYAFYTIYKVSSFPNIEQLNLFEYISTLLANPYSVLYFVFIVYSIQIIKMLETNSELTLIRYKHYRSYIRSKMIFYLINAFIFVGSIVILIAITGFGRAISYNIIGVDEIIDKLRSYYSNSLILLLHSYIALSIGLFTLSMFYELVFTFFQKKLVIFSFILVLFCSMFAFRFGNVVVHFFSIHTYATLFDNIMFFSNNVYINYAFIVGFSFVAYLLIGKFWYKTFNYKQIRISYHLKSFVASKRNLYMLLGIIALHNLYTINSNQDLIFSNSLLALLIGIGGNISLIKLIGWGILLLTPLFLILNYIERTVTNNFCTVIIRYKSKLNINISFYNLIIAVTTLYIIMFVVVSFGINYFIASGTSNSLINDLSLVANSNYYTFTVAILLLYLELIFINLLGYILMIKIKSSVISYLIIIILYVSNMIYNTYNFFGSTSIIRWAYFNTYTYIEVAITLVILIIIETIVIIKSKKNVLEV